MTKHANVDVLLATGQATRASPFLTLEDRFNAAISALNAEGARVYRTPLGVEHIPLVQLRDMPVTGTPYETVAKALGVPGEYGPVMDELNLTHHQLHETVCDCHYGSNITGRQMAIHLRRYAPGQPRATFSSIRVALSLGVVAMAGLFALSRLHIGV